MDAIAPVSGMPSLHAAVGGGSGICSPALVAGDPIPSVTNCRFREDANGLQKAFEPMNAGRLFYAYGYPSHSSSNVGYEADQKASAYFIVDAEGETYFVWNLDRPGNGDGGAMNSRIAFPRYPSGTPYPRLVQLDDPQERTKGGLWNWWNTTTGASTRLAS